MYLPLPTRSARPLGSNPERDVLGWGSTHGEDPDSCGPGDWKDHPVGFPERARTRTVSDPRRTLLGPDPSLAPSGRKTPEVKV